MPEGRGQGIEDDREEPQSKFSPGEVKEVGVFTGFSPNLRTIFPKGCDKPGEAAMNIKQWIGHFERNGKHRREPDWVAPEVLERRTKEKLISSLQQFQLGDGGGPAYLIAWDRARFLSDEIGIKTLVDLWFQEEREHSRLLGGLLKRFGAVEIQGHWSFSLFCGLRKYLGVQFELYALLLTEIVSHVYYKMLYRHGKDRALRDVCRLIIRDEAGHIAFHRARLTSEGMAHGRNYGCLWEVCFRLRGLLAGTVLWVNHRSALIAMGGSDREFYRSIWRGMNQFVTGLRKNLAMERCHAANTEEKTLPAVTPNVAHVR